MNFRRKIGKIIPGTEFCGCVDTTCLNMWNVSFDDEEEQDRVQQTIFHSGTISYAEFQNNVREILNNFCF